MAERKSTIVERNLSMRKAEVLEVLSVVYGSSTWILLRDDNYFRDSGVTTPPTPVALHWLPQEGTCGPLGLVPAMPRDDMTRTCRDGGSETDVMIECGARTTRMPNESLAEEASKCWGD